MDRHPADGARRSAENPTFNYKSLRGNAVLRWEYRPGLGALPGVDAGAQGPRSDGRSALRPSTRRLFDAQANDIFLVKATYYLNL